MIVTPNLYRIDELLEKQRKKRLREREKKYNNSISSRKSKKSTKSNSGRRHGDEPETIPAIPTLPVVHNPDLYAGEKKQNNPWLGQYTEQQSPLYYDSQPMTPLESSHALQRNHTNKYSPYGETPYMTNNNMVYQPAKAYTHQDSNNSNYYYQSSSDYSGQYNNTIATPMTNASNDYYSAQSTPSANHQGAYMTPHAYDSQPGTPKSQPPHTFDENQSVYSPAIRNLNRITTTTTDSYHSDNSRSQLNNNNQNNYHHSQNDENISMVSGSIRREASHHQGAPNTGDKNAAADHYDYYFSNGQNAETRHNSSSNDLNQQSRSNSKSKPYKNYI